jgi:hypothetical protein
MAVGRGRWRQSSRERKSERGRRRRAHRTGMGGGLLWRVMWGRKKRGVQRLSAPHSGGEDEGVRVLGRDLDRKNRRGPTGGSRGHGASV